MNLNNNNNNNTENRPISAVCPNCDEINDGAVEACLECGTLLFKHGNTKLGDWYNSDYFDTRDKRDPEILGKRILHASKNRQDVSSLSETYDKLDELGLLDLKFGSKLKGLNENNNGN